MRKNRLTLDAKIYLIRLVPDSLARSEKQIKLIKNETMLY